MERKNEAATAGPFDRDSEPFSASASELSKCVVLSEQQQVIIMHLAHGERYSVIAEAMHLSGATVSYHVDRLKRITGQKNAAAIVAWGFVQGFLSTTQWPVALVCRIQGPRNVA